MDPAGWSWPRLAAVSAFWVLVVAGASAALFARAMERGKETDVPSGPFVTQLPFGTRHLGLAVALALIPPLLAALRKALSG